MSTKDEILYTADNLVKLTNYIDQNVSQDQLNMKNFRSDPEGSDVDFVNFGECGTCGCALGWSPFVPDMPAEDWMYCHSLIVYRHLSFGKYRLHYYPALSSSSYLYDQAFGSKQSSKKSSVVKRLLRVARELRERAS